MSPIIVVVVVLFFLLSLSLVLIHYTPFLSRLSPPYLGEEGLLPLCILALNHCTGWGSHCLDHLTPIKAFSSFPF